MAALEVPLDAVMGEVINLGTGVATNVRTVATMILEQAGGTSQLKNIDNRPGQVDLHISSTEKAERLLRWRARTDLETGIAHTIDWYRQNESWWRKLEWMKHVPITVSEGRKVLH